MAVIDLVCFERLKNVIFYDDKPYLVENIIKDPETFFDWDEFIHNANNAEEMYATVIESNGFDFKTSDINENTDIKKRLELIRDAWDGDKTLSLISYERFNVATAKLTNFIQESFSYEHGAVATAHCYIGSQFSRSFCPHADIPVNFIFQVQGESKFVVYENRCSTVTPLASIENSNRKLKIIQEELRPCLEGILRPGDMLYIPSRQYHYIEPLSQRVSVSIPLVSGEEWYGMKRKDVDELTHANK